MISNCKSCTQWYSVGVAMKYEKLNKCTIGDRVRYTGSCIGREDLVNGYVYTISAIESNGYDDLMCYSLYSYIDRRAYKTYDWLFETI